MARPLASTDRTPHDSIAPEPESWLSRATARAFAAAVSALLIATLVVNRSNDALTTDGTVSGTAIGSGVISLVDDDQGQSLFDLSDMAPGRPVMRCIEVVYEGTIVPVDLLLRAEATGDLAPYLDVTIEQGSGGGYETCDGFSRDTGVFDGTLHELVAAGWQDLGRMVNLDSRASYRIVFELQDRQEALGRSAGIDFVWEVRPS